jgi:hypothetical protein
VEHPLPLSHVRHVDEAKKSSMHKTQKSHIDGYQKSMTHHFHIDIDEQAQKTRKPLPGRDSKVETIVAPGVTELKPKVRGFVAMAKYDPKLWFREPEYCRDPPNKVDGEPWNHSDNTKRPRVKGQDRMMRSVGRPSQCGSPRPDNEELPEYIPEYWPGRDTWDQVEEQPFNDYQVRAVHLPDMFTDPGALSQDEMVHRMKRLREYLRQRYGGRPSLLTSFRNLSLEKPGYIVPADLQLVFDQMA